MIRLNKFLASAGHGSRRFCDTLIRDGKVVINGKVVTNLATQVKPTDSVLVSGRRCRQEEAVYLLLNKPAGVVCSRIAQGRRKTVFDLVPRSGAPVLHRPPRFGQRGPAHPHQRRRRGATTDPSEPQAGENLPRSAGPGF
jgi:16S rRNA U516 pseudouridylate synthase RsuA-like enzyme